MVCYNKGNVRRQKYAEFEDFGWLRSGARGKAEGECPLYAAEDRNDVLQQEAVKTMYQFESIVRYSEIGENGTLSLAAMMNYLQDCSTFQSEKEGAGLEWLKAKDRAWLLCGWQIELRRLPRFKEKIAIQTRPYSFAGMLGYRTFDIVSEHGESLVWANSVWCYVQPSVSRPVRLTQEDMDPYLPLDPAPVQPAERKLKMPAGGKTMETFPVRREHLDTNHHVNNGQYIMLASDYLPDGFEISEIRAEYRSQARLGDRMTPVVVRENNRVTVQLGDGEKKVYAVIAFASRKTERSGETANEQEYV